MNGATVHIRCDAKDVGPVLHLLEDAADVFIVGQSSVQMGVIILELRSDRFPADWHGQEVRMDVTDGIIERFVQVVRPRR